ncbi:MAG: ATPase domain-containing protein [Candidatus Aenigmarchaeota archaeon]|nr:ATPase domain-containing protein [Candidatus Aenigmarchaeota archaeon]
MVRERVETGIAGLDKMLNGGFPKGSTILISGGPGTGKSLLSLQFLINGAMQFGENGVYISFEEYPERIIKNVSFFGWPIQELMEKKKLEIIRSELYEFDKFKILISNHVEGIGAQRLVIDPITVISLFFERPLEIRRSLLDLDRLFKRLGCTTLLTCEIPEGKRAISSFGIEEFMSDGIIYLYSKPTRALTVIKLRASAHDEIVRPFKIIKKGIVVNPKEYAFAAFEAKKS